MMPSKGWGIALIAVWGFGCVLLKFGIAISEARPLSATQMQTAKGAAPGPCTDRILSNACADTGAFCYGHTPAAACNAAGACGGCSASGIESWCDPFFKPWYYIDCYIESVDGGCGNHVQGPRACAWSTYCECVGGTVLPFLCSRENAYATTNCIPVLPP